MTVNRFENGKDAYASTQKKLEDALLATGLVEFDGDNWVRVDSPVAKEG